MERYVCVRHFFQPALFMVDENVIFKPATGVNLRQCTNAMQIGSTRSKNKQNQKISKDQQLCSIIVLEEMTSKDGSSGRSH